MPQELKGGLQGAGLRIAIVVSRFNQSITSGLLQGALEGLAAHGVQDQNVTVAWVPGSFEIPLIAKRLARSGNFDAIVCLGAVIRHQTDHYRYVAEAAAIGIAEIARETGVPVAFGVLTTENEEQAMERAGGKEGNKGYDAALTAIEMADLLRLINKQGY
ncbi:MAG: 6,7-dimethyl-8-ribityllumazine synthase [Chloroflexota bacterium]